nr:uncharacterized protein LOC112794656 [Arachis hypogaea]
MDLVGRQNEAHLESRVIKPQHNKTAMFAKPATVGKKNKKPSQKPHTNQNKGTIVNTSVSTWKGKEIEGSSSTDIHNRRKENYWDSINLIKQAQSMGGSDGWENGMFLGVQTHLPSMEASAMVEQLRLKPGVRNSTTNSPDPGANQNVNAGKSVSAISHIGVLSDNMVADIATVYGSPHIGPRSELWENLQRLGNLVHGDWCVGGDFNCVLSLADTGGTSTLSRDHARFSNCLFECGLQDIGFQGQPFTWQRGSIRRRLDRYVANTSWVQRFNHAVVKHLPKLKSDHAPLLLDLRSSKYPGSSTRPFRFIAAWMTHNDFNNLLRSSWDVDNQLEVNISTFMEAAKIWNREVFGDLIKRKNWLLARLNGISAHLSFTPNPFLDNLQIQLWKELENLLIQEEVYWKQCSRCKWINYGDKNTTYFHNTASARRRRNRVTMIKNAEGQWIDDVQQIQNIGAQHFLTLYTDDGNCEKLNAPGLFPTLSYEEQNQLGRMVTIEEIQSAMFSMGAWKAPGPDGLPPIFYQSNWESVKTSVVNWVFQVFNNHEEIKVANSTYISLIPKIDAPETFSHFRPIGLCNVSYKLITKIISHRLKQVMPKLIGPSQSSFVPGRQSADNIIIAQEAIHSMRIKKGACGYMAIKIDLEKAYDLLNWEFIRDTLIEARLPENLVDLISHCYLSAEMKVLWNGIPSNSFTPSRGIRQGDPMSPYLFVLCIERLSQIISFAVNQNFWEPMVLNRGGPKLSHLCFADDIVLFGKASMEQVEVVRGILDLFCKCSGQKNFLWGSVSSGRKPHLISWEKVCLPKSQGGLGLRPARVLNNANLMKLAWKLIHNKDALWVKIVRSKYGCGDDSLPLITKHLSSSNAWKGIFHIWKTFADNLVWRLGSGENVNFWNDHWMPGVHHLIDFAQPEVFPNMLEERVCDYVSDRRWDLNRIAVVLGDDWIPVFRSTKTPEPEMGEDILAWLLTSDGAFSIKSACSLYLSPSDNSKAKLFSKIWKLEAPQRLHTFCWLVANEVLLTNEIRVKRNMTHDGSCVSCGEAIESMFHVIRDCRVARQTWMSIDTRLRFGNFFNTPLLPWLLENLSSQSLFKGVHWPLLFVCTMNALWLRRNKVIFDSDEAVAENSIHFLAFRLAKDYSMAQLELAQSRKKVCNFIERQIKWKPPDHPFIKLNSDGSVLDGGRAACGGILRDSDGRFIS